MQPPNEVVWFIFTFWILVGFQVCRVVISMFEEILLISVHSVSGLTFQFLEMCFPQACESLSPS